MKLPNIECPNEEHPAGNRFMEHVGTRRQRAVAGEPDKEVMKDDEDVQSIAMFQCVKCKRVTTEPFDPGVPPAA